MTGGKDVERRYSDEEFAAILRQAAEEQGIPAKPGQSGLSLDEIRSIAREAGFDPDAVARIAASLDRNRPGRVARLVGGRLALQYTREVPVRIPRDALPPIIERVRALTGRQGTAAEVAGVLDWRTDGDLNQVYLTVTPTAEGTRVAVRGDRTIASILTIFVPAACWIVAFGVTGALVEPSTGAEVAAIGVGYAAAAIAAARTVWTRTGKRFRRLLRAVTEEVAAEVDTAGEKAAAEVDTAEDKPVAEAGDDR